jgi:hypothetical protein
MWHAEPAIAEMRIFRPSPVFLITDESSVKVSPQCTVRDAATHASV